MGNEVRQPPAEMEGLAGRICIDPDRVAGQAAGSGNQQEGILLGADGWLVEGLGQGRDQVRGGQLEPPVLGPKAVVEQLSEADVSELDSPRSVQGLFVTEISRLWERLSSRESFQRAVQIAAGKPLPQSISQLIR